MVGDLSFLDNEAVELQELEAPAGELHLRFRLASGRELALAAAGVAEVLSVSPDQITPMPNVSPLLLGTLNLRGAIIWVADVGQLLGVSVPLDLERPELSIIAVMDPAQDLVMGLAVDSVIGMEWLETEKLQTSQTCPDPMTPFVKGAWADEMPKVEEPGNGDFAKSELCLLNQGAILHAEQWVA